VVNSDFHLHSHQWPDAAERHRTGDRTDLAAFEAGMQMYKMQLHEQNACLASWCRHPASKIFDIFALHGGDLT
jgi:hypothetical protein